MANPCNVRLNVGGKLFVTTGDTLRSLPHTRLGRLLASDHSLTTQPAGDVELFFDRNPKIVNSLLDLYRTGELHLPKNLCARTVEQELEFWEIPKELVHECCFRGLQESKDDVEIATEIDNWLRFPYDTAEEYQKLTTAEKIWYLMERPSKTVLSKIWSIIYFSVVLFSAVLFILQTSLGDRTLKEEFKEYIKRQNISVDEALNSLYATENFFISNTDYWMQVASVSTFGFFLLEFLVRFLTCPVKRFFVRQARNWLDLVLLLHHLVAICVDYLYMSEKAFFPPVVLDTLVLFYTFSALRMLRILYIVKDYNIMKILLLSTKASLKELLLLLVCMLSLSILYGTFFYLVELLHNEVTFHSIPHAMWYSIVTMTTVGYGDVVPFSTLGKVVGTLCAFSGLITIALPVAVVASNFSKYYDNMTARCHMMTRLAFLRERPDMMRGLVVALQRQKNEQGEEGEKEKEEMKEEEQKKEAEEETKRETGASMAASGSE